MRKLNRKAVSLFPEINGDPVGTVEHITFEGSHTTSRRRVLEVFRAVLADLEKPKAGAPAND